MYPPSGSSRGQGCCSAWTRKTLQILGVDTVPGRDRGARDAHQHHEDPEGDRGDQEEDGQAARHAPGHRLRGLREQLAEHPDGTARERRALRWSPLL